MKRGEIYYDPQYTYLAGNTEDKLLVVFNKLPIPLHPVIVVPAATNKAGTKYNPGCNHRSWVFFLRGNEDFFTNDTKLQVFFVNHPIPWQVFHNKKLGEPIGILKQPTIDRIVKCLNDLRVDIDEELHQYLF